MTQIDDLIDSALSGEKRSISRLISMVERGSEHTEHILRRSYPCSGNAYYIGVTGPPGAGKSTIVDRLIRKFCQDGKSVGIIAVDPSSPFSGGALLGDRVRIDRDRVEGDVFFRSMSAGRVMGGLSRTAKEASRILDACGKQIIILETVGVGQSELDIAQATDTVLVVLVPESGDSIQTFKAGLMEIGDIFVVNKSDRPGADNIAGSIESMLDRAARHSKSLDWQPSVFSTSATSNQGVDALYNGIMDHFLYLRLENRLELRRKGQLKNELLRKIDEHLFDAVRKQLDQQGKLDGLVEDVWCKKTDIYSAAKRIAEQWPI